jgi:HlyD family secretion protein
MKVGILAASLAVLGFWYADQPVMRSSLMRIQNELGIQGGPAALVLQRYLTAPVLEGQIRRVVTATGTLNAIVNVEVGSQLSGQIAEVFVDFNDNVRRGEPLARLDQRSFEARLEEARAAVELADVGISMAKAKLERGRIDALESEAQSAVLKARLDIARISLDAAQLEFQRKQTLRDRGAAAVAELEDANTKLASASAALREAEATVAVHAHKVAAAQADLRRAESESESATHNLTRSKALLHLAEIDLDRTVIRSPIDGVIVGRKVNEGQTLATQLEAKTLFIVAGDLREMQIEAKLDEADISVLMIGQQASFTVDAYLGRQFTAAVRQVRKAPEVQQNVVTYTVVLSASNADNLLLPGMTSLVHITVNQTGPVLKVPLAALRFTPQPGKDAPLLETEISDEKSAVLWVVGDYGEPKPVRVRLGEEDSNDAALLGGELVKGDRVIVGEMTDSSPGQLFGIRTGL